MERIYSGLWIQNLNVSRGTAKLQISEDQSLDIPQQLVEAPGPFPTPPLGLDDAISLGHHICRLVGTMAMLDYLYVNRHRPFFKHLYSRITTEEQPPALVSIALRVGRLDVHWSVLQAWQHILQKASSPLFATRALESLATSTWNLTTPTAAAIGEFASSIGLVSTRCKPKDASIVIEDGQVHYYLIFPFPPFLPLPLFSTVVSFPLPRI